jgi:hypothetical protein
MNAQKVRKLVGFEELLPRFGISDSRTTLNRKMKKKPPEFPQCVRSASGGRINWFEDEVAAHIASLQRGAADDYPLSSIGTGETDPAFFGMQAAAHQRKGIMKNQWVSEEHQAAFKAEIPAIRKELKAIKQSRLYDTSPDVQDLKRRQRAMREWLEHWRGILHYNNGCNCRSPVRLRDAWYKLVMRADLNELELGFIEAGHKRHAVNHRA